MLDETWNITNMQIYDGERSHSTVDTFTTVRDTVIATSGTMRFEKDSEKGVRAMTYTDANGQVLKASFIIEADVENDNPEIEFIDLKNLFPEPYYESRYKVVSFSKTHIDLLMVSYGSALQTKQECTITLVK